MNRWREEGSNRIRGASRKAESALCRGTVCLLRTPHPPMWSCQSPPPSPSLFTGTTIRCFKARLGFFSLPPALFGRGVGGEMSLLIVFPRCLIARGGVGDGSRRHGKKGLKANAWIMWKRCKTDLLGGRARELKIFKSKTKKGENVHFRNTVWAHWSLIS